MNLLFVSPNSPFISVGGVERYLKNLLYFSKRSDNNFIFLLPSKEEETFKEIDNIKIYQKDFLNLGYRKKIGAGRAKLSQREIQKNQNLSSIFS